MRKTLELLFQINLGKPTFKVTWVNRPTRSAVDYSPGWESFLALDFLWFCVQVGWFDSDPLDEGEVR